jgi:hypothetical protein
MMILLFCYRRAARHRHKADLAGPEKESGRTPSRFTVELSGSTRRLGHAERDRDRAARRRVHPGLGAPSDDPSAPPNSADPAVAWLQRARARLNEVAPVADDVPELTEPEHRELLNRYIAAFQNADPAALEHLLRNDATLEAPPLRTWYAGIKFCMPYMAAHVLGSPGHWRMLPASANGQPAVAAYYRGSDGTYQPYGIVVLTVTAGGISRITAFGDPGLVTAFGFPAVPPADDAR